MIMSKNRLSKIRFERKFFTFHFWNIFIISNFKTFNYVKCIAGIYKFIYTVTINMNRRIVYNLFSFIIYILNWIITIFKCNYYIFIMAIKKFN